MSKEQVKDRENMIANMFAMIGNIICLNISDNTDSAIELDVKKIREQEDSSYIQKMEEGIQKYLIKEQNKRRSKVIKPIQEEQKPKILNRTENNKIHKDYVELDRTEDNEIGG